MQSGILFAFLLAGIASALMTALHVPHLIRLAFENNFLDRPGGRKTHDNPMPVIGGQAIVLGLITSLGLLFLWSFSGNPFHMPSIGSISSSGTSLPLLQKNELILLALGCMLMAVGFFDDILVNGLHYRTKLIFQSLAAIAFVTSIGSFHISGEAAVDKIISVLWLIGFTNAFNFLDGMDGLASGTAIIIELFFGGCAIIAGSYSTGFALSLLIGTTITVFLFNKPKARFFLGDSGSLFLGFIIAGLAIMLSNELAMRRELTTISAFIVAVSIPVCDAVVVTLRRLGNKKSIFHADRTHLHHRLQNLGFSIKQTLFISLSLTLYMNIGAFLILQSDSFVGMIIGITNGFLLLFGYLLIHWLEQSQGKRTAGRMGQGFISETELLAIREEIYN